MKPVTVYSTSYCPYCDRAKRLLAEHKIPFRDIDVTDDDEKREEISKKTGSMTVPVIFIGEEFIGGASELGELAASGDLEKKVNG